MAKTPAIRKHVVQAVVTSTLTSDGQSLSGAQFSDDNDADMNTEITEQGNMSDDNEIVSEVDHEGAFSFKLKKSLDSKIGGGMETNPTPPSLFDTFINAKGVAVKMMIDDWKQEWLQSEQGATLQLVNLILRSSNVPPADRWEEEDPAAVVSALQDHITNPSKTYALSQKKFRYAFEDFWMKWTMDVVPEHVNDEIIENGLMSWIVCMSSSAFRPLRMTATTAVLKVLSGCAKSVTLTGKQRKKQTLKDDKIAFLKRIIQVLFDSVFVQRYRDVDTTIRERCLAELIVWIETCPETFLDNTYLRYLGWSLSDKQARVRRLSATGIKQLLKPVAWRKSLKSFTDRFTSRLVEMASKDVDESVRHSSMTAVAMLHECKMLPNLEEYFLVELIKRKDWQTLQIASKLFAQELSSRVTIEPPFRAGIMVVELIHLVERFVPEGDLIKALERIIEVTGHDISASLGDFLDIIALVNARLASFTEGSSARKVVARVYGRECDDSMARKLVNVPVDHHLILCCYRSLVQVTGRTEHVASIATSVSRVMKTPRGCDEAIKMLHLISESEALPILEELVITNHDSYTPELTTELWSKMENKEQVTASQERILHKMIEWLAFDEEAMEKSLLPVHVLAELTKQIKSPAGLSSRLIDIIDNLSVHLQLRKESESILKCWSAMLQCFFQDLLWRLKDACKDGDPEFMLLDKRDRLVKWCDLSRCVQEYVDDPNDGHWSRALSTASILVDLACLSSNSIPSIHGWRTDIDCQAVFDLLGFPGGTEEERIKLVTMACKTIIKLGQDTGIRHVLRVYHPSVDALIRAAFNHVKDRVNMVDCAMSAIENNTNIEALMGILKLAQPFLNDSLSVSKMMLSNAVLAEDDQIIAKCINPHLLPKLTDEERRSLLDFIEDDVNLGNFKGGPALANLIKQLGRKKIVRKIRTAGDAAISSAADAPSVDHPTSEQPNVEYNVIMDRHTQHPVPTLNDYNNKHILSDPFVQAEMQTFTGASPFVQEDAANPFADENPFYDTKYSDGRTSQVESEDAKMEGKGHSHKDPELRGKEIQGSENRSESDNKRTFRNRTRINYAEPEDYVAKKNSGKLKKSGGEDVGMESPAKKPKRQHIRL